MPRHTPVVDTSASPYASLRPVAVSEVTVADPFWQPRLERNRTVTLPTEYALCESTGALRNFKRAAGTDDGPFNGQYFSDRYSVRALFATSRQAKVQACKSGDRRPERWRCRAAATPSVFWRRPCRDRQGGLRKRR
jgi:hypothetical protein